VGQDAVRRVYAVLATLSCAVLPIAARAAPSVHLHATLSPEQLGHGTTIGFSLQITAPAGQQVPPPLTQVEVRYPRDFEIGFSDLGTAMCSQITLEKLGPEGCPADSRMGYGSALAEIPLDSGIIHETGQITLLRGPTRDGHFALLFFVNAEIPVWAPITLPSLLLPAPAPFGGRIDINVPIVPTFPSAPDVSVVRLRATIGPQHLTYYERHHGRLEPYRPEGILLPDACPRGDFPFAATLAFAEGSRVSASTIVPCPAKNPAPTKAPMRKVVSRVGETPRAS
jgi:hypothetical protein